MALLGLHIKKYVHTHMVNFFVTFYTEKHVYGFIGSGIILCVRQVYPLPFGELCTRHFENFRKQIVIVSKSHQYIF